MTTQQRRAGLRQALLDAAQRNIAAQGLKGVRARTLATEAGCAIGQIYNVWPDLDSLIIAVNARTLDDLDVALTASAPANTLATTSLDEARAVLLAQGEAYLDFARHNGERWRAVFEHRLAGPGPLPTWYREQQARLFSHVDRPLRALLPELSPADRAALGRSIFSAVHGVVWLGLEELLGPQSYEDLHHQVRTVMGAIVDGLCHP